MDKFTLFSFFKSLFLAAILPVYVAKDEGGASDTDDKEDDKSEEKDEKDEDRGDAVDETDEKDDKKDDKSEEEDETDETDDKSGKSKAVPHSRFNEVVQQRNYWAEKYKELEAQGTKGTKKDDKEDEDKAPEFDFDKKEEEYLQAVADGDVKLAKAIRGEIRKAERSLIEYETEQKLRGELDAKGTQITESQKVDQLVKEYETSFPMLKKGNKDFDGDLVTEILDDYKERLAAGVAPSKAIEKSTRLILRSHGIDFDNPGKQSGKTSLADGVRKDKKEEARGRNADASTRQPAKMGTGDKGKGKNLDAEDIDVNTLTDEEWDALPAATKKKLRGDNS